MARLFRMGRRMLRDRRGASALEYVMMAAILGIVAMVGSQQISGEVIRMQGEVTDKVAGAMAGGEGAGE